MKQLNIIIRRYVNKIKVVGWECIHPKYIKDIFLEEEYKKQMLKRLNYYYFSKVLPKKYLIKKNKLVLNYKVPTTNNLKLI